MNYLLSLYVTLNTKKPILTYISSLCLISQLVLLSTTIFTTHQKDITYKIVNLRGDDMEMEPTFPKMAVLPENICIGLRGSDLAAIKTKYCVIYEFL